MIRQEEPCEGRLSSTVPWEPKGETPLGDSTGSKPMKQKLDKEELIGQLNNQLNKIADFASMYDSGKITYAQDIAVKLRVIFHNTNKNINASIFANFTKSNLCGETF